jgi:tetratricopeptide (TPR) repeat protein
MTIQRNLTAAQGYLELGMPAEALVELDNLPESMAGHAEILQLKLVILMQLRSWEAGAGLCQQLRDLFPQITVGYVHGAFCLHEMGRTKEAKALLLSGPAALLREATYHYNLGCYEAVLGNVEEAMQYLRTSFAMDHNFRIIAKRDPDLRMLTNLLE